MTEKKKTGKQQFKERMIKQLLTKFLFFSLGILALSAVLYFFSNFLFGLRRWDMEDPLYLLAKGIEENYVYLISLVILGGSVIILFRIWLQSINQLTEVLEATGKLYQNSEEPIALSANLMEFDKELNQIRQEVNLRQQQAKEAEQRKNDLIVYLAHDLKTPLTSVIGYLTLLHDELEISTQLREKYLAISLEKAEHLEELINEFFEIARFNLSNIELEPTSVRLDRMLNQVSYEFLPMLKQKQLTIETDFTEALSIHLDVDKMQRVFDNLVQNAINYSYAGTTISLSTKVDNENQRVNIYFTNHGPTVPPEKLARIFEQFFRLDTARQTNRGGAGLGLAVAKKIVELHGGVLSAESENEKTTFMISLSIL
ncbi:sensor histidine kinase [Enterococcus faecalis]|nr:sensor histidine kinase [Enterococcus faecalis]EHL2446525.1 HAMP domain-containing histidine kinase [Enterococcus faecalis]EHL2448638.1 HAMP domain-containing histidine kinase [Enterococcus faecalis]